MYTQCRIDNVRRVTECGSNVVCKLFDCFFNGVFSTVMNDASILERIYLIDCTNFYIVWSSLNRNICIGKEVINSVYFHFKIQRYYFIHRKLYNAIL